MAIRFARAPMTWSTDLARGLHDAGRGVLAGAATTHRAKYPLPAYVVAARALAPGFLAQAGQTGWRSLLETGPSLAELTPSGGGVSLSGLVRGPLVTGMIAALARLSSTELTTGDFGLRIVEVPVVASAALWFSGRTTLLFPYAGVLTESGEVDPADWEQAVIERNLQRDSDAPKTAESD